jgi:hypothetical protein
MTEAGQVVNQAAQGINPAGHVMTPAVFGLFEWSNFVASLVSVVLALVAIVLAWMYKRETDTLNARINNDLNDIKTETMAVTRGTMVEFRRAIDELDRYSEWMRRGHDRLLGNAIQGPMGAVPAPPPPENRIQP